MRNIRLAELIAAERFVQSSTGPENFRPETRVASDCSAFAVHRLAYWPPPALSSCDRRDHSAQRPVFLEGGHSPTLGMGQSGWEGIANFGRGNISRINVRRMLLRTYRVAQTATDVELLPPYAARPFWAAFVNARLTSGHRAWRCSCQACATVTIDAKTVHSAERTTSTINPSHINEPFCAVPVVIVIRWCLPLFGDVEVEHAAAGCAS